MKKLIALSLIVFIGTFVLLILQRVPSSNLLSPLNTQYWQLQSIDTMKYSRDLSRNKLNDSSFDSVIDKQMQNIAATGANYVAIGTPYDSEFKPILVRWVAAARKYHLHVWFRGNLAGWEGWFDYPKIDRETHTQKIKEFILANEDLFEDGDIFSSCPECENGVQTAFGDPYEVTQYQQFLINEYNVTKEAFASIHKQVPSNYYSMNGDVAKVVMDKETTQALDGLVVVDHYVATPEALVRDLKFLASNSGGKVILGEFGAPIPDIHGTMTDEQQAAWISQLLQELTKAPEVVGLNYWVNTGGSTALWSGSGSPRPAVKVLTSFYIHRKLF